MFYEFNDDLITIDAADISTSNLTAGYVSLSNLCSLTEILHYPGGWGIMCAGDNTYSSVESVGDCVYGVLNIVNPSVVSSDSDRIGFYITKNMVLIVELFDEDCSVRDGFLSALHRFDAADMDLQRLCYSVFDTIIGGDSDFMQDMEEHIDSLEQTVLQNRDSRSFNSVLLQSKKQLLHIHSYYNSLEDILEAVKENLLDECTLVDLLIRRVGRLRDNVRVLSDSVVHLREAYQSALEIRQNNIMKILTLFTVFFSPLSFVAGWYGMNFVSMPELRWKYGYLLAVGIAVTVVVALLLYIKRKGWI